MLRRPLPHLYLRQQWDKDHIYVEGDLKTPHEALPKDLIKNQVYWGKSMKEKECCGDNIYLERIVSMMHSPALQRKQGVVQLLHLHWSGWASPTTPVFGRTHGVSFASCFRGHEKDWLALAEFVRVKDGLAMGHAEERQHFMITGHTEGQRDQR